jgi:hypothetical protein
MGQTIAIKEIQPQHYGEGMDLLKEAIRDYVGKFDIDPIDFNFKAKNFFVTPGNISRAIFLDNQMIGFVVCTHYETLWNNEKKLSVELFYLKAEHRSEENINKVYAYVEHYAFSNGYASIQFDDSLPYFSDYVKSFDETRQVSVKYEKELT